MARLGHLGYEVIFFTAGGDLDGLSWAITAAPEQLGKGAAARSAHGIGLRRAVPAFATSLAALQPTSRRELQLSKRNARNPPRGRDAEASARSVSTNIPWSVPEICSLFNRMCDLYLPVTLEFYSKNVVRKRIAAGPGGGSSVRHELPKADAIRDVWIRWWRGVRR